MMPCFSLAGSGERGEGVGRIGKIGNQRRGTGRGLNRIIELERKSRGLRVYKLSRGNLYSPGPIC